MYNFIIKTQKLYIDCEINTNPVSGLNTSGRLYSAAPGAEAAKFRSGSVGATSMFGSLFPGMQSRR